jgi:hypothetical protein
MGYSNHEGIILVYHEGTNDRAPRIARVHHTIVDHYGLSASPADKPLPNKLLMQAFHCDTFDSTSTTKWQMSLEQSNLDTVTSSFKPEDCHTIEITLPPKGTSIGFYRRRLPSTNSRKSYSTLSSSPSDFSKIPKLHSLDHPSRNGTASHSHRSEKRHHQPSTRRTSKCRNHSLQNGGPSLISPSKLPSMVQLVYKSHPCSHGSAIKRSQ